MNVFALIVAGGSSSRFGGELPKQYCEVSGRPLLAWTLSRFETADTINHIVVVVAEEFLTLVSDEIVDRYRISKVTKIVSGGASRQESVRLGLQSISELCEVVAIHDAARSMIQSNDIDILIRQHISSKSEATILASPVTDTIKEVSKDKIVRTVDRARLVCAETPQVFAFKTICALHENAEEQDNETLSTDDAYLAEAAGITVKVVRSVANNIKVTTADDLKIVESMLQKESCE